MPSLANHLNHIGRLLRKTFLEIPSSTELILELRDHSLILGLPIVV